MFSTVVTDTCSFLSALFSRCFRGGGGGRGRGRIINTLQMSQFLEVLTIPTLTVAFENYVHQLQICITLIECLQCKLIHCLKLCSCNKSIAMNNVDDLIYISYIK